MTTTSSLPRRRVLFVSYLFPPVGGVGVHRVTKFVKYLPQFGWDCSVLTVANPSTPLIDGSLRRDVPVSTVVCRAKTLEPGYAMKAKVGMSVFCITSGGVEAPVRTLLSPTELSLLRATC